MQQVADDERLVDVELELAVHATDRRGDVVAHDLGAKHGQGLALRRVDLAGHDAGAGLVLRQHQLAETATGAAAEVADILGNLGERRGERVESARGLDDGVVGGQRLELVGRRLEIGTCHLADLLRDGLGEALEGVDARAYGGTTLR